MGAGKLHERAKDSVPLMIQYGRDPVYRKVLMIFNAPAAQIVMTPEDAEEIARQLLTQVEALRGSRQTVS